MNSKTMSALLRSSKPSHEEWLDILESVRQELNPLLDKFTLKSFGELGCIHDGSEFYQTLSKYNPKVIGNIPLETHGISYFNDSGERLSIIGPRNRKITAWGLSKSGKWVLIEIEIDFNAYPAGTAFKECPTSVSLSYVTLQAMLEHANVTAYSVWQSIILELHNWEGKRRTSYEYAHLVVGKFDTIDAVIKSVMLGS